MSLQRLTGRTISYAYGTMNPDDPAQWRALIDAARRDYDALLQRLGHNEREFRRLGRAVFRVQEHERKRIARELHDGVGQNLTALKHQLHAFQEQTDIDPASHRARCAALIELVSATLDDTREMSRLLRPQILDDLGLDAALAWLVRSLSSDTGPRIECRLDADAHWDEDQASLIFRVAQEALTNAIRHAGARVVEIELTPRGNALRLRISDDGQGFDCQLSSLREAPTTGLSSMRERVQLFGGKFALKSKLGAGCTIEVVLPSLLADDASSEREVGA